MSAHADMAGVPAATGELHRADFLVRRLRAFLFQWGRYFLGVGILLFVAGAFCIRYAEKHHQGYIVGGSEMQAFTTSDQLIGLFSKQDTTFPKADRPVTPGLNSVAPNKASSVEKGGGQTPGVYLYHFRWIMVYDSFGVVLGYLLLLLFEYLILSLCLPREATTQRPDNGPSRQELLLHLACLLPVAAAVFDLAENGVTLAAAEDAVSYVLADETVVDMHGLSTWKWRLLGLSSLCLGFMAWRGWRLVSAGQTDARLGKLCRSGLLTVAVASVATAIAFLMFPKQPEATFPVAVFVFGPMLLVATGICWRVLVDGKSRAVTAG